jgi:Zn-dependent protease with chaperone function
MLRRLACLLPSAFCLLSLVAPTCAQAALISRSAEISLGRDAAQEYESSASVDADPALAARVNRIGQRLIAAAGTAEYPFEFHAVETNGINAFALPGGFIYVYRGLTQLVPGDDALAFILAHETAHVLRRHGVRQIETSLALGAVVNLALHRSTAGTVLRLALEMRHSRQDEAEADRLGLEMMAKAGFDPTQGAEAMAVVARAAKSGRSLPPFLRSHPLPESRITALRRQAETLRAAPRPTRAVTAPPLPTPAPLAAPPTPPSASDLFPLQPGLRWTYRVSGATVRQEMTTAVLEEHPDQPGVYRLRTELTDDLATTDLLAVTPTAVLVYRDPAHAASTTSPVRAGEWQLQIDLPMNQPEPAAPAWETVRVPAGEFRALRATQLGPDRQPAATVWLAPSIGIVRRAWERTGLVEELEALRRPAPEEVRGEGHGGKENSEARSAPRVGSGR